MNRKVSLTPPPPNLNILLMSWLGYIFKGLGSSKLKDRTDAVDELQTWLRDPTSEDPLDGSLWIRLNDIFLQYVIREVRTHSKKMDPKNKVGLTTITTAMHTLLSIIELAAKGGQAFTTQLMSNLIGFLDDNDEYTIITVPLSKCIYQVLLQPSYRAHMDPSQYTHLLEFIATFTLQSIDRKTQCYYLALSYSLLVTQCNMLDIQAHSHPILQFISNYLQLHITETQSLSPLLNAYLNMIIYLDVNNLSLSYDALDSAVWRLLDFAKTRIESLRISVIGLLRLYIAIGYVHEKEDEEAFTRKRKRMLVALLSLLTNGESKAIPIKHVMILKGESDAEASETVMSNISLISLISELVWLELILTDPMEESESGRDQVGSRKRPKRVLSEIVNYGDLFVSLKGLGLNGIYAVQIWLVMAIEHPSCLNNMAVLYGSYLIVLFGSADLTLRAYAYEVLARMINCGIDLSTLGGSATLAGLVSLSDVSIVAVNQLVLSNQTSMEQSKQLLGLFSANISINDISYNSVSLFRSLMGLRVATLCDLSGILQSIMTLVISLGNSSCENVDGFKYKLISSMIISILHPPIGDDTTPCDSWLYGDTSKSFNIKFTSLKMRLRIVSGSCNEVLLRYFPPILKVVSRSAGTGGSRQGLKRGYNRRIGLVMEIINNYIEEVKGFGPMLIILSCALLPMDLPSTLNLNDGTQLNILHPFLTNPVFLKAADGLAIFNHFMTQGSLLFQLDLLTHFEKSPLQLVLGVLSGTNQVNIQILASYFPKLTLTDFDITQILNQMKLMISKPPFDTDLEVLTLVVDMVTIGVHRGVKDEMLINFFTGSEFRGADLTLGVLKLVKALIATNSSSNTQDLNGKTSNPNGDIAGKSKDAVYQSSMDKETRIVTRLLSNDFRVTLYVSFHIIPILPILYNESMITSNIISSSIILTSILYYSKMNYFSLDQLERVFYDLCELASSNPSSDIIETLLTHLSIPVNSYLPKIISKWPSDADDFPYYLFKCQSIEEFEKMVEGLRVLERVRGGWYGDLDSFDIDKSQQGEVERRVRNERVFMVLLEYYLSVTILPKVSDLGSDEESRECEIHDRLREFVDVHQDLYMRTLSRVVARLMKDGSSEDAANREYFKLLISSTRNGDIIAPGSIKGLDEKSGEVEMKLFGLMRELAREGKRVILKHPSMAHPLLKIISKPLDVKSTERATSDTKLVARTEYTYDMSFEEFKKVNIESSILDELTNYLHNDTCCNSLLNIAKSNSILIQSHPILSPFLSTTYFSVNEIDPALMATASEKDGGWVVEYTVRIVRNLKEDFYSKLDGALIECDGLAEVLFKILVLKSCGEGFVEAITPFLPFNQSTGSLISCSVSDTKMVSGRDREQRLILDTVLFLLSNSIILKYPFQSLAKLALSLQQPVTSIYFIDYCTGSSELSNMQNKQSCSSKIGVSELLLKVYEMIDDRDAMHGVVSIVEATEVKMDDLIKYSRNTSQHNNLAENDINEDLEAGIERVMDGLDKGTMVRLGVWDEEVIEMVNTLDSIAHIPSKTGVEESIIDFQKQSNLKVEKLMEKWQKRDTLDIVGLRVRTKLFKWLLKALSTSSSLPVTSFYMNEQMTGETEVGDGLNRSIKKYFSKHLIDVAILGLKDSKLDVARDAVNTHDELLSENLKVKLLKLEIEFEGGESVIAMKYLDGLMKRKSKDADVQMTADMCHLYATWAIKGQTLLPKDIIEKYLKPAVLEGRYNYDLAYYVDTLLTERENDDSRKRSEILLAKRLEQLAHLKTDVKSKKNDFFIVKAERQIEIDTALVSRSKNEMRCYLVLALENYMMNLKDGDYKLDHSVLRMVSLWFSNYTAKDVNELVSTLSPLIPTERFLVLMYQLAARLTAIQPSTSDLFYNTLSNLSGRIISNHPIRTMGYLTALKNVAKETNATISNNSHHFLKRLALKNRELKSMVESFDFLFKAYIQAAVQKVEGKKGKLEAGTTLLRIKETHGMPILTTDEKGITIVKIDRDYKVPGGIHAPKVLTCLASNGVYYRQLVKSKDDLRQDLVLSSVFEMVDRFLKKGKDTKIKGLGIRTYKIVPLAAQAGVVEWIDGTEPLGTVLLRAHSDSKWSPTTCRTRMKEEQANPSSTFESQLKMYSLIESKLDPAFGSLFFKLYRDPKEWYRRRSSYIKSVATTSMVGFMLGIGDRHVQNLLFEEKSGEIIHIDLGIAFDQGKLLSMPETVPFRLTRDMVDAMGITKHEGLYKIGCCDTLKVLRNEREILFTLLDVFRHDPLYTWVTSAKKMVQSQGEEELEVEAAAEGHEEADLALFGVRRKLEVTLGVECHVQMLINIATDKANLCRLFSGWQAWL